MHCNFYSTIFAVWPRPKFLQNVEWANKLNILQSLWNKRNWEGGMNYNRKSAISPNLRLQNFPEWKRYVKVSFMSLYKQYRWIGRMPPCHDLLYNKHLMTDPSGNSEFCFPEKLNVPRGEVPRDSKIEKAPKKIICLRPLHTLAALAKLSGCQNQPVLSKSHDYSLFLRS